MGAGPPLAGPGPRAPGCVPGWGWGWALHNVQYPRVTIKPDPLLWLRVVSAQCLPAPPGLKSLLWQLVTHTGLAGWDHLTPFKGTWHMGHQCGERTEGPLGWGVPQERVGCGWRQFPRGSSASSLGIKQGCPYPQALCVCAQQCGHSRRSRSVCRTSWLGPSVQPGATARWYLFHPVVSRSEPLVGRRRWQPVQIQGQLQGCGVCFQQEG